MLEERLSTLDGIESRYRREGKKICIDFRVRSDVLLFDARDPAPALERDLSDNFVDYVLASVQSFPLRTNLKLVINFTEKERGLRDDELRSSIRSFFAYEALLHKKRLRNSRRNTEFFLFGGIVLLLLCLFLADLAKRSPFPFVSNVLHEGLLIGGWVGLWRPLESLLYDWWPITMKIRYLNKLSKIEIVFR